jgi:hypothetical protein
LLLEWLSESSPESLSWLELCFDEWLSELSSFESECLPECELLLEWLSELSSSESECLLECELLLERLSESSPSCELLLELFSL